MCLGLVEVNGTCGKCFQNVSSDAAHRFASAERYTEATVCVVCQEVMDAKEDIRVFEPRISLSSPPSVPVRSTRKLEICFICHDVCVSFLLFVRHFWEF